jgi:ATPase family AAA domain-containing protein 3A/B
MFGGAGRKPKKDETLSSVMSPENAPSRGGGSSVTGFDPEGLERAAKAARELDASRNASAAIELIKTQEATKQHEAAAKRAEMDAYSQQLRQQNIQAEAEEARKTLEAQTQHDKHRSEYRDELERKRQVDMLNAQKYMQDEQLKKQEEMVERQEAMRRKTAEIEAELRTKTELAKARAEAEGRIRQERENHDLIMDKVRLEAAENRSTVLKAVADGGKMLGEGLSSYLTDGEKLRNTAFMVSLAAVGIYSAKTAAGIGGRFIEVSVHNNNATFVRLYRGHVLCIDFKPSQFLSWQKRHGWVNLVLSVRLLELLYLRC